MQLYYTAITSTQKKITGTLFAENQKVAHDKLNDLGLAILTLGITKPEHWLDCPNSVEFEFETKNNAGEVISGTIQAADQIAAFDKLTDDLKLKVQAIYPTNLNAEQKSNVRATSVPEILQAKKEKAALLREREKRSLAGGFSALVKIARGDALATNNSAQAAESLEPGVTDLANSQTEDLNQRSAETNEFKNKFDEFYFLLTEVIIPSSGKTRTESWQKMQAFFLQKSSLLPKKICFKSFKISFWDSFCTQFWLELTQLTFIFALVFGLYYLVAILALQFSPNFLTEIATKTTQESSLILFLFLTFVILKVLLIIREKVTGWSMLRTFLLFLLGGFGILVLGLNLL